VAVPDEKLEGVALDAGAVADADDLETLLEPVGDAGADRCRWAA
jgi:hypothetical protein